MEAVWIFIKENWKELIVIIYAIVMFIIALVKGKPIKLVDSIKSDIFRVLPSLINSAEKVYPNENGKTGSQKKNLVLELLEEYLLTELGLNRKQIDSYIDFATEQIENILSTPQKKGN